MITALCVDTGFSSGEPQIAASKPKQSHLTAQLKQLHPVPTAGALLHGAWANAIAAKAQGREGLGEALARSCKIPREAFNPLHVPTTFVYFGAFVVVSIMEANSVGLVRGALNLLACIQHIYGMLALQPLDF